jgi:hypothetical protein
VDADLITQLIKQRKHEAGRPGKPGSLEKVKRPGTQKGKNKNKAKGKNRCRNKLKENCRACIGHAKQVRVLSNRNDMENQQLKQRQTCD